MSAAPRPLSPAPRPTERLRAAGPARMRQAPTARRIARRRFFVTATKWLLPVAALGLLSTIAVWPEVMRLQDQGRVVFRRAFSVDPDSARMQAPRYRGVDERGRPYTMTADWATQDGPQRVLMAEPKGDLVLESGGWLLVQSREGVYVQHAGQLDLSKDVQLYRDDGTMLRTETAAIDVKAGAAASNDQTHAEGPFGELDAQGFTLTEKGAVIQFQGPARLVLRGSK